MTVALALGVAFAPAAEALAQNANTNSGSVRRGAGPRKQLATIIFSGLGGAVLGLSTLSFYGRPQDNLNNIAVGFAVGVILGTSYVTYTALTNPAEFYGLHPDENDGSRANLWAGAMDRASLSQTKPVGGAPSFNLTWLF